ncbi:hypothetical protein [Ochrobactrum sp. A-1]|uniref:hypothetical protein n=1 Tax=Ochrobactrum sp. A-1 TaxID=2920940 RepID=UPI001F0A0CB7|nr:hypothetical protein [Ochrobactrum sp. A-1]
MTTQNIDEDHMLFKTMIILASLSVPLAPLAVQAKPVTKHTMTASFKADNFKELSPHTTELSGNVSIKVGGSEIKTDRATLTRKNDRTKISTKEFEISVKQ